MHEKAKKLDNSVGEIAEDASALEAELEGEGGGSASVAGSDPNKGDDEPTLAGAASAS